MTIKLKPACFFIISVFIFFVYSNPVFSYLDVSPNDINEINVEIKSSINSPIGNATVGIVTFVGAFLNVSFSTVGLITGNITLIINIGIRIWLSILYALGIRKRNKPWGVVYDSASKSPINLAYILLKNLEGKIVASAITDASGRYAFLVDVGVYSMIVNKGNYIFPSHHVIDKTLDDTYPDTYWGDYFEIKEKGEVINRNIPLDRRVFGQIKSLDYEQSKILIFRKRDSFFTRIANILFYVGVLFSVIVLFIDTTNYNIGIFLLYLFLFLIRFIKFRKNKKGKVLYKKDSSPLAFGILHVLDEKDGKEILKNNLDSEGGYICLLPNGMYKVMFEKRNPDGTYTEVYKSEIIKVKNGFLKQNFMI